MRSVVLFILAVVAISVTAYLSRQKQDDPIADLAAPNVVVRLENPSSEPAPSWEPQKKMEKKLQPPSLDQVREEVAHSAEKTPPSLLKFGKDLGARMTQALQSESDAAKLMPELKDCVQNTAVESAAALCLQDAFRLQEKFIHLNREYAEIVRVARPEVVELFRSFSEAVP